MKKEYRDLRRRPLLTPLWLTAIVAALVVAGLVWAAARMTTTTVIVVRHAEKELGSIEDPPLSTVGEQRVLRLAGMFGERGIPGRVVAVLATNTRRAQSTAAPLAARLGVSIEVVADTEDLLSRIRREHRGKVVLVVGHSNTVPVIVRRLSGIEDVPEMAETDYSTMYVVSVPSVGKASVLRIRY